jgi:hypothetical protein
MSANVTLCCAVEGSMQRTQAASLSPCDPEGRGLCCLLQIRHGAIYCNTMRWYTTDAETSHKCCDACDMVHVRVDRDLAAMVVKPV